jgi:hypothetical protein
MNLDKAPNLLNLNMFWKITCATSESSLLKLLSRLGRSMALSATTASEYRKEGRWTMS